MQRKHCIVTKQTEVSIKFNPMTQIQNVTCHLVVPVPPRGSTDLCRGLIWTLVSVHTADGNCEQICLKRGLRSELQKA